MSSKPYPNDSADRDQFNALWYKDAIIYQTHVKAYGDSNGDGIGDFRGLTERLDYIQQLGVTAVWLLPFYPSPQRDDGYDISEYRNVHPDYGTMADCRRFIREAHRRNLRVITELIINHTSDQHPWFQAARRAPKGSAKRNYYVWSDDDTRYADSRIIFTDTETSNWAWDPVAKQYYWHRFFSHQPDLNFDNPHVLRAVLKIMQFWLDIGVDGLRLDAIPYLIERESTSCENLPETHAVLKQIRAALDARYADRMLLAEANQWPEDVREYFADGDECHMAYHFPVMPRMYMAVAQEDRYPIIDIMGQTPEIPDNCQWAIFLRNHDELTLEMVTDRERDYMYRTYAYDPRMRVNVGIRRRLAPLLDNDMGKIKLMNGLLLSLLGTPVLYYGDEIGMGDNIYLGDRNGVRTPMQWSPDRNAGFSRADPQRLYLPPIMDPAFGYEAVNVEAQSRSPASLLNWMRRMIAVRKQHVSFGRGTLRFLHPVNRRILAYLREYEVPGEGPDVILCVANLSRSPQPVELNLAEFEGLVPVELTGRTAFPAIGALPYLLTLPGHGFYWFQMSQALEEPAWHADHALPVELPLLVTPSGWGSLTALGDAEQHSKIEGLRKQLLSVLPEFLAPQRWFAAKNESIRSVSILREHLFSRGEGRWLLLWLSVEFERIAPQVYFLPLSMIWDDSADELVATMRATTLARVRRHARMGVLCDAFVDAAFCRAFVEAMVDESSVQMAEGELRFSRTRALPSVLGLPDNVSQRMLASVCAQLEVDRSVAQGSNTAVVLHAASGGEQGSTDAGDDKSQRVFLKAYRQWHAGVNPELEIGRFLADSSDFSNNAPMVGAVEFVSSDGEPSSVAIVQGHVHNQGDAWEWTLGYLERLFEAHLDSEARRDGGVSDATMEPPGETGFGAEFFADGEYIERIATLGGRTAEMHLAFLNAPAEERAFVAEPITADDLANWSERISESVHATLDKLAAQREALGEASNEGIEQLLDARSALLELAAPGIEPDRCMLKCRHHGDYHLGQVLVDRNDFIIIDFEGEPSRSLPERRFKHSPLRDVAGMLRSFDYAAASAAQRSRDLWPEAGESFAPRLREWQSRTESAFLDGYRETRGQDDSDSGEAGKLLLLLILEKALYELRYELDHRPAWLHVPLQGLLRLIGNRRQTRE